MVVFLLILALASLGAFVFFVMQNKKGEKKHGTGKLIGCLILGVLAFMGFLGGLTVTPETSKPAETTQVQEQAKEKEADKKPEYLITECEQVLKAQFPNQKISIPFTKYEQHSGGNGILECTGRFELGKKEELHDFHIRWGIRETNPKYVVLKIDVDGKKLFFDGDMQTQVMDEATAAQKAK